MNYQEARAYIAQIAIKGSELGLTSITNLLAYLGNPQDSLKFIHIAGTNGKGSVLAYLASVLAEAGYRVGRYISPTLFSYRERIQINGDYISRDDFARLTQQAKDAADRMTADGLGAPTVFEVETAISFLYFLEQKCDAVLLETGMGGRLDATNVEKTAILTILASISMDHMEFLGNTLGEIAWNKAGIMKYRTPVVSAHQEEEAASVIREEALKNEASLVFVESEQFENVCYGLKEQHFSYKGFKDIRIPLAGIHQIENAALALEAIEVLRSEAGFVISDHAVKEGMWKTVWKGRLTVIGENPLFIIDGAHNPDAARVLCDTVTKYFPNQKKYYIFGVFSDKEYDKIINIMAPHATYIYAMETPDNPRALPAEKLAEAVRPVNPNVEATDSIEEAVSRCMKRVKPEDVIIAFGSLSHLSRIEQAYLSCKGSDIAD